MLPTGLLNDAVRQKSPSFFFFFFFYFDSGTESPEVGWWEKKKASQNKGCPSKLYRNFVDPFGPLGCKSETTWRVH